MYCSMLAASKVAPYMIEEYESLEVFLLNISIIVTVILGIVDGRKEGE